MDKTTRKMINYLKTLPDFTYYWQNEEPQTILPDAEFKICANYMIENGYAEKITSFGNSGGFRLNHKYVHEKEFNRIRAKEYLLQNWIAILALIISIVSIVASPFLSAFFTVLYNL